MKLKHVFTILLALYIIGMMYLSVTTLFIGNSFVSENDKYLHFAEFFVFGVLLLITLFHYKVKDPYLVAFVLSLSLVLITEMVQMPIIGRSFSTRDMVADMAGIACSFALMYLVRLKWKFTKR